MKIALRVLATIPLLTAPALRAQAPAPAAPKPGPEQQKLAYFAGRWNEVSDLKPGPMGPGGKMTATSTCEWFAGGFNLVCHGEGRGPGGENRGLAILGYSTERKRYTYYGIDNAGMAGSDMAYGDFTNDTWSWEFEALMGGKPMKGRYVIKVSSPNTYTWQYEVSVAGGPMTLVAEGADTRVK